MKKALKTLAIAGGVLCALKGFDNRLEITDYKISSVKIPKDFNGFRIVQISDFHNDNHAGISTEIKALRPDIIVSTGDLADDEGSYTPAIRLCENLVPIAPVYAVTGNHDLWRSDYSEFERDLSSVGVVTLHNERIFLQKGDSKIGLCGIDDPFSVSRELIMENLSQSIAALPKSTYFDILLFHRANLLGELKHHGFDLILSGHMHGGQIRLPWGNGVFSPTSSIPSGESILFPKYFGGYYSYKDTHMIVNRGLGNPMIIPRLFNRPEITVITLFNQD